MPNNEAGIPVAKRIRHHHDLNRQIYIINDVGVDVIAEEYGLL
jgi:hypothetical protein